DWTQPLAVQTLKGHMGGVSTLIELKDGHLASGSQDKTIKVWNKEGNCIQTLKGHTGNVRTLIVLKDGCLASGSSDNTIKVWNKEGKCLKTLKGHEGWVYTLIELKDGSLASGSYDKTIKIWNKEGKCLKTLKGHEGWVFTLIELKDGRLASGSYDKTIKIWDAKPMQISQQPFVQKMQQEPDRFVGLSESSFNRQLLEYQRKGHAMFSSQLQEQERAFAKAMDNYQTHLDQTLFSQQHRLYQDALEEILRQHHIPDPETIPSHLMVQIQQTIDERIGTQLESQITDLFQSQLYQREVQQLQEILLQRIGEKQGQVVEERTHAQQEQERIKDKQSTPYQAYETKQRKLSEQQELLSHESIRVFYTTIEKVFGARLISAMVLARGMVKREDTDGKAAALTGDIAGGLCEGGSCG
ncbi:MAG TPA: hypothetical protein ENI02_02495, partial [Candidatus Aminicenantes bacterium]|nr:hypothetical protein [Candidatus Aminicenantes bacterium]